MSPMGLGAVLCVLLFSLGAAAAAPAAAPLSAPLDGSARLPAQAVPPGKSVDLPLPALPAKPGKILVLRFRAFCRHKSEGGCNYNASLLLNGAPVGRYTTAGEERLLIREPAFEFRQGTAGTFPALSGTALMVMFAPDAATADAMAADGRGATFCLDVGDIVRGVDGNTLTLRNNLKQATSDGHGEIVVEDLEVGWLDRGTLPPPKSDVPDRGPVASRVAVGDVTLYQARGGGFAVGCGDGIRLRVETALAMKPGVDSALVADDAPVPSGARVSSEALGPAGYRVAAEWPGLALVRTLEIGDGLVWWREQWTNTGEAIRGVPFRHRVFLDGEAARFWIGGSPENQGMASSAQNPTLFVASQRQRGRGVGITAESDWLRLLMALRARSGVGEVYSDQLALAPGSSIDFTLTLAPVREGGYWSFVNALRRRWGVNGTRMERPVFWGYARAPGGGPPEERARRSLGHLGPVTVVLGPWQRLEPDARVVTAGRYPRLPEGVPRAPGACPDLDVEAFLSLRHREAYWEQYGKDVRVLRKACPNVRVMQMMHPSMETVYKPLQERWPIAGEAIRTPGGAAFEDAGYSRAWLQEMAAKDWGVLYYVPRPGSAYLDQLLAGMRRSMDQYGSDGMYCDEFSWAFTQRGYSRYDYSRWDGYSADLDPDGKALRLKCDNGHVTEPTQLRMVGEVLQRGKFFLGNGAATLRSVNALPVARFIEGGNGTHTMGFGHLSTTPLVLGNMGDETTRKGVFESVRLCLSQGCVYSPTAVNLLLDGPESFVCKLYPITLGEIGPGWVMGKERLVTTESRTFAWPGKPAKVRLYRYDSTGNLQRPVTAIRAGAELKVDVPDRGLLIAEMAP